MHLSRLHYTLLINLIFHLLLVICFYFLVSTRHQQQLLSGYSTVLLLSPFLGLIVVKLIDFLPFDPLLCKYDFNFDWTMAYAYIRKLKGGQIQQDTVYYAHIFSLAASLFKVLEFWLFVPFKGLKYFTHFIQSFTAINWLVSLSKPRTTDYSPVPKKTANPRTESLELLSPPCLWIDEPLPSDPTPETIDRENSIKKMNEYVQANPGAFIARCILTQCWRFKTPQPRARINRNTAHSPSPLSKTLYI